MFKFRFRLYLYVELINLFILKSATKFDNANFA